MATIEQRTQLLRRWFPDQFRARIRYPIIAPNRGCSLRLNDRLLWSYLAGCVGGDTGKGISEATGLNRTSAVKQGCQRLVSHGLVVPDGHRWRAVDPPEGCREWLNWFKADKQPWSRRYQYLDWIACPDTKWLSITVQAVYWGMWSLSEEATAKVNTVYLAGRIGVHRNVIRPAIDRLESVGLVKLRAVAGDGLAIGFYRPTVEHLSRYPIAPPPRPKLPELEPWNPEPVPVQVPEPPPDPEKVRNQRVTKALQAAGVDLDDSDVLDLVGELDRYRWSAEDIAATVKDYLRLGAKYFYPLFTEARKDHQKNGASDYRFYPLLRWKVDRTLGLK